MIAITLILSLRVFSLQRTRLFLTRGEQGYTLRCCGDLTCGYFRGCCTEAEKPKTERVVVISLLTGRSITGLHR